MNRPFPNYTEPLMSLHANRLAWDVLSVCHLYSAHLQNSVQTPSLLKVFMDLLPQSDWHDLLCVSVTACAFLCPGCAYTLIYLFVNILWAVTPCRRSMPFSSKIYRHSDQHIVNVGWMNEWKRNSPCSELCFLFLHSWKKSLFISFFFFLTHLRVCGLHQCSLRFCQEPGKTLYSLE